MLSLMDDWYRASVILLANMGDFIGAGFFPASMTPLRNSSVIRIDYWPDDNLDSVYNIGRARHPRSIDICP